HDRIRRDGRVGEDARLSVDARRKAIEWCRALTHAEEHPRRCIETRGRQEGGRESPDCSQQGEDDKGHPPAPENSKAIGQGHRVAPASVDSSSTWACSSAANRSSVNRSAESAMPSASHGRPSRRSSASRICPETGASKKTPVLSSMTVSRKPPQRSTTLGLPN